MNPRPNDNNDDRLRDALRSAYETPEPSEALQQRIAWLAERQDTLDNPQASYRFEKNGLVCIGCRLRN